MRTITTHHDGHGLNDLTIIEADDLDEKAGGASHVYTISRDVDRNGYVRSLAHIQFQHGARTFPDSTHGALDGAVLAVLIDRFECFQAGPFACRENAIVLTKLQEAMHWIKHRADDRARRNVLGRNEK
jgi:hypothetical protein